MTPFMMLTGALGALIVAGVLFWYWKDNQVQRGSGSSRDRGLATWEQLRPVMGRTSARQRAARRIPTVKAEPDHPDAVVHLGRHGKHDLFMQHEDSVLVFGPPRSGKTRSVVGRMIASAPGPLVTTSTKAEILRDVGPICASRGTVWAWDPTGMLTDADNTAVEKLRWDPVRGCEDPEIALRRGQQWTSAAGGGEDVKNASFWQGEAAKILARYLHAAALIHGSARDIVRWAENVHNIEPVQILEDYGPPGWADTLRSLSGSRAGETTDSVMMTLRSLLNALASPRAMDTLCPDDNQHFDIPTFLEAPNTLFLLCSNNAARQVGPIFAMLLDEIVTVAWHRSQEHPAGFLWPPMRMVLDEVANVAPLRDLDSLMSDSGGRGIQVIPVVQSLAQLRLRWGREAAAAILATATVQLVLPGEKEEDVRRYVSSLAGKRRVVRTSRSSRHGEAASTSRSTEWEDVLPEARVHQLPDGHAWMMTRSLPVAKIYLPTLEEVAK